MHPVGERLITDIRQQLEGASDRTRAPKMQAYMKSAMPYYGVPIPAVRKICTQSFAQHILPDVPSWRQTVRAMFDDARFREERYAAVALSGYRAYDAFQRPAAVPLYRHLITRGAWWDTVDEVAGHRMGELLRRYPAKITPTLLTWSQDPDMWLRRTSIIAQLGMRGQTDIELLAAVIEHNIDDEEFFIRKAIGWALRQYARHNPEWVRRYVADHEDRLSGLSKREALKHL